MLPRVLLTATSTLRALRFLLPLTLVNRSHAHREAVAVGLVARAAGVFENAKRICKCDGVSVWRERDVPAAGGARALASAQRSSD